MKQECSQELLRCFKKKAFQRKLKKKNPLDFVSKFEVKKKKEKAFNLALEGLYCFLTSSTNTDQLSLYLLRSGPVCSAGSSDPQLFSFYLSKLACRGQPRPAAASLSSVSLEDISNVSLSCNDLMTVNFHRHMKNITTCEQTYKSRSSRC